MKSGLCIRNHKHLFRCLCIYLCNTQVHFIDFSLTCKNIEEILLKRKFFEGEEET